MANQGNRIFTLRYSLEDYISSLKRKPGKHVKLIVNAEVRFVNGKWTVAENNRWVDRKPVESEMLGGDVLVGADWVKIFKLPELSRRARQEEEINQEIYIWLKKFKKKSFETDEHVSQSMQTVFNRSCRRAKLPYRIINRTRSWRRKRRCTYIGKLF